LAGLKLAKEIDPDIILTDVQMPHMNKYEFCKELRRNFDTSHIPVIMFTAKTSDENTFESPENEADDYFPKPFNASILKVRVNNLYQSLLLLRKIFIKEPEASVTEISPSVPDERFLKRAYEIVEKIRFNSFAYFIKSFKEYFGVTPSKYKR
jgi:DNA-binding response OmpR family regulator